MSILLFNFTEHFFACAFGLENLSIYTQYSLINFYLFIERNIFGDYV